MFIICRQLHLQSTGSGHNLGDLVLLLVQLELYEEISEHIVDSVEIDVRVTKLMLGVEGIPDVATVR